MWMINAAALCEYASNQKSKTIDANDIMRFPAVDAEPVQHGRWIDENPDDFLDPRMRCSICTRVESPLIKWRYCPNCGAKMDGDESE